MEDRKDNLMELRKYFLLAGLVAGILISVWYLYQVYLQKTAPGVALRTDSVGMQVFNVFLIFMASFFQFSLFHKGYVVLVGFFRKKREG